MMDKTVLLTKEEAATRLKISIKTLDRRIRTGSIPAFKEGGRVVIFESDLDEYIVKIRERIIVS